MGKNAWNNLKRWLGMGVLAGGLILPKISVAGEDLISVYSTTSTSGVGGGQMYQMHLSGCLENFDDNDSTWAQAPPNPENKSLKIYTKPYAVELKTDGRPP